MELTLEQALQKGIDAHKAGKVQEADKYYTAILKANPKHPDANHNMGVLAVGVGKVEAALPFFKTALETNPNIEQFWISYIDAFIKLDRTDDAKAVLEQAKSKNVKGDGFHKLVEKFNSMEPAKPKKLNIQEPAKNQILPVINLYETGQYQEALTQALQLLKQFPNSLNLLNILGATYKGLGKLDGAIEAFKRALSIKPDDADAYNNMGAVLKDQGKLEEAIEAYNKALSIKPDYAEAFYNMGNTLQDQGKLDGAIEAYNKAISIKPDYAEACNNMGFVLKDQGKLEGAIEAYNKALSIKPDYAEAHRNISTIKKYTEVDEHFLQVQKLYRQEGLSQDAKCIFNFALAKMYEDIGEFCQAYKHFHEGNALRKKLKKYSINQDMELFSKLRNTQPYFLKCSLEIKINSIEPKPIFILGMPRSGTTLVEQILSSHSEVTGGGELMYLSLFGKNLIENKSLIDTTVISEFRDAYLSELSKLSNGGHMVIDKMPQNFRFIPIICAAFPEAKIIHVQRDAAAVCWSNYKSYFISNGLGYANDIRDVVIYFQLYKDLMKIWRSQYPERIYNLNYEDLTRDQEKQTRKLIEYLGLNWQDACLSPHKNKRSVRTASQQQVRQKVYTGSSQAWRIYEPYLNGAFDGILSE